MLASKGTMENVKEFLQGLELNNRTAVLLTSAACGLGAVVVLVRKVTRYTDAMDKIQRARDNRTKSLQLAEQAVLRYKQSVSHV